MTKIDLYVGRTDSLAPIEVSESPSRPSTRREPSPSFEHFRLAVDERLDALLRDECDRWCNVDANLQQGFDVLRSFIANGGKRIRPAFAFWGFVGCGGDPLDPRLVDLGAALEMLHTFALVHDDVMDGSALRRHAPTVHCALQADHERHGWLGEASAIRRGYGGSSRRSRIRLCGFLDLCAASAGSHDASTT